MNNFVLTESEQSKLFLWLLTYLIYQHISIFVTILKHCLFQVLEYTLFYKNTFYKNMEDENCEILRIFQFKNKPEADIFKLT